LLVKKRLSKKRRYSSRFRFQGSGNSRIKKVGGHCGAKEKVGGQHKCRFCMVIFCCFEDYVAIIYPINPTCSRLVDIVKYELALLFTRDIPKRPCRCNHTRVLLCPIFCANHATSTALHMWNETPFSVRNCADPTWTKTAPRKWIHFTWKRNYSNHKFHL